MPLCELCRSISLERLPPLPSSYWSGNGSWKYIHAFYSGKQNNEPIDPVGRPYHSSVETIRNSAEQCDLCNLILRAVGKVITELDGVTEEKMVRHNSRPGRLTFELSLTRRRDGGDGFWVFSKSEDSQVIYLVAAIGVCVRDDDPLRCIFIGRPVERDSGSSRSLDRAVKWAKQCDEHPECSIRTTPLPFRILELGDHNETIKLRETDGESGHYITLSHCWGKSKQFMTTRAAMATHLLNINFNALPKTFQDAVTIARAHRVRYIWIDSLCICQDDREDWQRESAKMASVYSNSYLNIAATFAKDSTGGCFAVRPPRRHVSIDYTSPKGESGELLAFLLPLREEGFSGYLSLENEPLTERAWALQERVLSRRILHYGTHQMYFECNRGFLGENGLQLPYRFNALSGTIEEHPETISQSHKVKSALGQWNNLVQAYGERKLTNPSDKLPALSGLARIIGERLQDSYVAGLWRNHLVEGLLWESLHYSPLLDDKYRAPSWSWASFGGSVGIMDISVKLESMAKILDCHIQLKGLNPYGEVTSGYIRLQAPLVRLFIVEQDASEFAGVPYERNPRLHTESGDARGEYSRFDYFHFRKATPDDSLALVASLKDTNLFALVLAKVSKWEGNNAFDYRCLIVSAVEGGSLEMRRLGFIDLDEKSLGNGVLGSFKQPIITLL